MRNGFSRFCWAVAWRGLWWACVGLGWLLDLCEVGLTLAAYRAGQRADPVAERHGITPASEA